MNSTIVDICLNGITMSTCEYDIGFSSLSARFNSGCEDWQFLTDKVIAPDAYTFVTYTFIYGYNTGTARISTPFLYKESYGQSYVYDSEGNVVSSTDAAETEATFAYQDDALTESLSPTGSRYMYANDDTTKNTRYAISNSGQKIGFSYNLSGDATVMQISDLQFIPSLEYTSGETVDCYIVNAKNGRVLQPHALSAGNKVYAKNFDYTESEMWQLRYLSGYVYTVRCKSDTTLGLSKPSADAFCYAETVTVNSSYVPNTAFKFSIESNGDGSFKISTASSGHTEYLYQTDGLHYEGSNSYSVRAAEYDEKDPAFKWYLVSTDSGNEKMKTSATYSADGRQVTEATDVMGGKTSYQYGENGLVEKVTDPRNVVTGYTYDSMNRTTKVESGTLTQGENGSQPTFTAENTVQYTYDKDLLKNILVDEGILRYSFDYDVFGRKTAVYVGGATERRTLATYTYTDRLLTRQTYGNGTNFIDFEYDGLDRLTKKTYNGDATKYVKYLYDPNGNQYGIQDGIWGKNTYFEYDLAGRVNGVGVYDTDGTMRAYQSVRYNDGKGTVESMSSIMFSAAGSRLREVDYTFTYGDPAKGEIADTLYKYDFGGGEYTFTYDGLARLEGRTLKYGTNTKTESYTYKDSNLAGFTTTLVDTMTDFSGKAHSYTYDANGNILSETYDNYTVTYEYDNLNRMTRYNNPSLGSTYVYAYDDRGNITSVNMYEYSAGDLGEATYVINYGYADPSWPDLMTSYYGTDIVYDDLGNPQNWVWGETLTWQNGRQLAKYESDGKTVNYTYNADGLRTSKSGDRTTEYFIVDGQYIGEVTKVGYMTYNVAYLYDENGSPAGLNVNGQEFFFVKNIQGDVLGLLNSRGTLSVTYRYDAYGNTISMKDSSGNEITNPQAIANVNPFRYRGYMYDIESGYYYLRSRYYDPSVGRFLNGDGEIAGVGGDIQGYNQFAYCFNNPVNLFDPVGSWPKWIKKVVNVFCKTVETLVGLALSPFEAIHAKIAVGSGLGASGSANIGGVDVGVDAVVKSTVSAESDGSKADFKYTLEAAVGLSFFDNISLNLVNEGEQHSFVDEDCNCTIEEFGPYCEANEPIQYDVDPSIGISLGVYCVVGGEVSISFHPNDWFNEMHNILIDYANTLTSEGIIRKIEE